MQRSARTEGRTAHGRRFVNVPRLIAHRGYPRHYPENTLPAIEAALTLGAAYVEFDVQLSADGVPFVIHDDTLERTTSGRGAVGERPSAALAALDAGEPMRFGARFRGTALPTLAAMVDLLSAWPGVGVFVELKRASLERFGVERVLTSVQAVLAPIAAQCVIISFDAAAVAAARAAGLRGGWVFEEWSDASRRRADALAPEFLFTDHECVPAKSAHRGSGLWSGPWQWALYDISDPDLALQWATRGAGLIETWSIGEMLAHPLLGRGRRHAARV